MIVRLLFCVLKIITQIKHSKNSYKKKKKKHAFQLTSGRPNFLVHKRHCGKGEILRSLQAALIFQRLPPRLPLPPRSPLLFPHKRRFIKVFVRHKLIYSLWWLWAACTQHFIKYPSNLLITVCLTFLASGASEFVMPSAAHSFQPARLRGPDAVSHMQTTTWSNGPLMRCLTVKMRWHKGRTWRWGQRLALN